MRCTAGCRASTPPLSNIPRPSPPGPMHLPQAFFMAASWLRSHRDLAAVHALEESVTQPLVRLEESIDQTVVTPLVEGLLAAGQGGDAHTSGSSELMQVCAHARGHRGAWPLDQARAWGQGGGRGVGGGLRRGLYEEQPRLAPQVKLLEADQGMEVADGEEQGVLRAGQVAGVVAAARQRDRDAAQELGEIERVGGLLGGERRVRGRLRAAHTPALANPPPPPAKQAAY